MGVPWNAAKSAISASMADASAWAGAPRFATPAHSRGRTQFARSSFARRFVPASKRPATAGRRASELAARNAAQRSRPSTMGAPLPSS